MARSLGYGPFLGGTLSVSFQEKNNVYISIYIHAHRHTHTYIQTHTPPTNTLQLNFFYSLEFYVQEQFTWDPKHEALVGKELQQKVHVRVKDILNKAGKGPSDRIIP